MTDAAPQTTPQWAIDAASEIARIVGFGPKYWPSDVAAIIARHAPKNVYDGTTATQVNIDATAANAGGGSHKCAAKDAEIERLHEALIETVGFYRQYEDRECLCAEAIGQMSETILAALDK